MELMVSYERARISSIFSYPDITQKIAALPSIGSHDGDPDTISPNTAAPQMVLSQLKALQASIENLQSKMDRFRRRLNQTDPVTGNPRYGSNAAARVTKLLANNDQLQFAMSALQTSDIILELERIVAEIEIIKREREKEEDQLQRAAAESLRNNQEEQRRKLEQKQQEDEYAREQERLELHRRAEELRRARLAAEEACIAEEQRVRQEQLRRDAEWMDSIPKGVEGVEHELAKLRIATQDDPVAQKIAVDALHTLFSQIVSHPEQVNYRRVRRDHPQFHADIGRHDGGKEILIAAGFRLGAIDGISCFISTEPNVENDLDGWSDWFNLLKETLSVIERELLK